MSDPEYYAVVDDGCMAGLYRDEGLQYSTIHLKKRLMSCHLTDNISAIVRVGIKVRLQQSSGSVLFHLFVSEYSSSA